jgi:hypothetical protein
MSCGTRNKLIVISSFPTTVAITLVRNPARNLRRGANDSYGTASMRTLSSSSASLLQLCATSKYAFCNSGSSVWFANSLQLPRTLGTL